MHIASTKEKPLDRDVRNFRFDSFDDIEGRTGASVENTAQRGWRLLDEISEHLLRHVLVFHEHPNAVFCFHKHENRAKKAIFVRLYKGKAFF